MAIKVRHDQNATATLTAAAQGGKGKRQAEDSKALAQISAQQNMAGNRQNQGAHAQVVSPGHAVAQLGHAQMISPGSRTATTREQTTAAANLTDYRRLGDRYDFRLTDEQRMEIDQINRDLEEKRRSGQYTPDEMKVFEDQATERRMGIKPLMVPKEERELTEQGRRERAALVGDITKAIKDGRFSKEELPGLMREFGIAEDQIRMADSLRDAEPTPEEKFRKNTFTDRNGVVFSPDGKVLYNPQEAELKRMDALRMRADKFEEFLRKPRQVTREREDGTEETGWVERTDDEISAIMRQKFPELYPQPTGGTGDPIVVSPLDPLSPDNPMYGISPQTQQPTAPVVPQPTQPQPVKRKAQGTYNGKSYL